MSDIRFRISNEEKSEIKKDAKSLGLSVSAFIRFVIKQWRRKNKDA